MYTRSMRNIGLQNFQPHVRSHRGRNSKRHIPLPEFGHSNACSKQSQVRDRKNTRKPATVVVPLGREQIMAASPLPRTPKLQPYAGS